MSPLIDAIDALKLSPGWLAKVLLLSLRLGAVLAMTPVMAAASVPARVRVLLVLGLSVALSQALPGAASASADILSRHPGAFIQAAFSELALGATLGLGIILAFAAFTTAGRLLDIQVGFGMGQTLDPLSNARAPIITTAFNQLAVLVFFMVNGHHALLRGVAYSLERFPLGQPWPLDQAVAPILREMGGMFTLAFLLAAPVVFSILLVEMGLGVLARNMPQVNMLVLGIPVKIVVGLVALALWFSGIGPVMTRVYGSIYQTWNGIFLPEPMAGSN